jgi:endoglucanase
MVHNKITSRLLFCFIICFFSFSSSYSQGFLKVNGRHLENDSSKNFILRGMGFGGWMLQEGYMFKLGFLGQQYKIKEKITEIIGKKEADIFYEKWLQNHTRQPDIDSMASWGFNSIRLPMHYNLFTLSVKEEPVAGKNTWLREGFKMVDELLAWCKKNELYLILDLHAAPGGQGNDLAISDRNPQEPSLWESEANREKTIALWKELATRYANEPNIGGYDILNETNWGFSDTANDKRGIQEKQNIPLRKLFIDITKAIRAVDTNHIIYLEGNGFANNYHGIFPLWDDNLVISFHKYGNFTTKETIQNFLDFREKYNVPLWLGETGENSNTWFTNTIKLAENNDIGWCWWQLKKMGINNPLEIVQPNDYDLFVDYCKGNIPKPSVEKSKQILSQLLENIKIENNIYHKDVTDAMFRQVQSTSTLPFKSNVISNKTIINAVDFDLGRNGFAYNDKDTASYMYTPGVHTQGNRGRTYRNDGVDIKNDKNNQPYIFNIENDEWLLYTLFVEKSGNYHLSFTTSGAPGIVNIYRNEKLILENFQLPATKDSSQWKTSFTKMIHLEKGVNKIKIYFEKGDFNLKNFQLELKGND